MADFSIGAVASRVGDIQRTYTWELRVTPKGGSNVTEDDLIIRARTSVLPGRSQDVITSNFMGMEQFFPGRMHFTNPFNVTFEEFEDRKVAKAIYLWQQFCFDVRQGGTFAGAGSAKKPDYCSDITLQMLDYQGQEIPANRNGIVLIKNAWPESVAEVPLSYAESAALQYAVAFRYDTWEYKV